MANSELGSTAYHKGGHVAFGQEPTLVDAAHEAAHYVQGVGATQLQGGVGQAGDVYERHAGRVAEAVVAGESAEPLLDRSPGGGGSPATATCDAPVQMTGGSLSRLGGMGLRGFASRGRWGGRGRAMGRQFPTAQPSVVPYNRYGGYGGQQDSSGGGSNYFPWGLGMGAGLGLAALAGGLYAMGRQQEELPGQTEPMSDKGGSRENVKLGGPQFFDSAFDFRSYISMIQHHVNTMRNRSPDFYTPFTHINDYRYGVMEALIAQTNTEVIEENLRRIEERYTGVIPQPGTADLFRMAARNSRGQYETFTHLTGRVNMGDRSFHSHLRVDQRQLIEKDEEGKEVMGGDGKPLRKWIRLPELPEAYGVPAGTVLPSKDVPYTYVEDFDDGPTHYKGQKIRGYPPTSTTFIPMARFSGIPLPQAFSALMLAELAKNASMGVYNQIDTSCVPWPLDLARAGGADIKQIAPEYASGERDLRNTQLAAEIDYYLACHTDYHPDTKILKQLRDQEATVVGRDGVTRPLNFHEGTAGIPDFEVFARYTDGTRPWREPQDAP